jgi:hypothetical protein
MTSTPTTTSSPRHLDFATTLTQWNDAPAPESMKPKIADRAGLFMVAQLVKQATGRYTAAYDFSEA